MTKDRLQQSAAQLPLGSTSWNACRKGYAPHHRAARTAARRPRRSCVLVSDHATRPAHDAYGSCGSAAQRRWTAPCAKGAATASPNDLVEYAWKWTTGNPGRRHRAGRHPQPRSDCARRATAPRGTELTLAELRLKRIQEGRMLNKAWTMAWYEP